MVRTCVVSSLAVAVATLLPASGAAQSNQSTIRSALAAAPPTIAASAAVNDLTGHELRAGSNGWTCYPDIPDTPGTDAMCVDATWATWVAAWQAHTAPRIEKLGIAYMLTGGSDASNTDPFATAPAPGGKWIDSGPHLMILVPDARLLSAMSTDPMSGGPYVMWSGTPYAHVMVPVGGSGH